MLLYLDLDRFKRINDEHGHEGGDQALCDFAQLLLASVRDADVVARLGGDEFAILLLDASADTAATVTKRLEHALERFSLERARPYVLSASVGMAHYDPAAPGTLSELLPRADQAMYEKKRSRPEEG